MADEKLPQPIEHKHIEPSKKTRSPTAADPMDTPPPPTTPLPPCDQRVSEVIGERICAGCGFNLFGQPIVREHYYAMLIVRCPECAMVAGLQEYPFLGKWANRWGRLLAGLWLVAIMIALFAGAGILAQGAFQTASKIVAPISIEIGKSFQSWYRAHKEDYESKQFGQYFNVDTWSTDSEYQNSSIDFDWWVNHGQAQFKGTHPSATKLYDWTAMLNLLW